MLKATSRRSSHYISQHTLYFIYLFIWFPHLPYWAFNVWCSPRLFLNSIVVTALWGRQGRWQQQHCQTWALPAALGADLAICCSGKWVACHATGPVCLWSPCSVFDPNETHGPELKLLLLQTLPSCCSCVLAINITNLLITPRQAIFAFFPGK